MHLKKIILFIFSLMSANLYAVTFINMTNTEYSLDFNSNKWKLKILTNGVLHLYHYLRPEVSFFSDSESEAGDLLNCNISINELEISIYADQVKIFTINLAEYRDKPGQHGLNNLIFFITEDHGLIKIIPINIDEKHFYGWDEGRDFLTGEFNVYNWTHSEYIKYVNLKFEQFKREHNLDQIGVIEYLNSESQKVVRKLATEKNETQICVIL